MGREAGISKITVFPLEKDQAGSKPMYGEATPIPHAVSFETEDKMKDGTVYSDNVIEEAKKAISSVDLKMEVSSATKLETDALLTGATYKDGGISKKSSQKSPALATAYEIYMTDGNVRRRIIYNTSYQRPKSKIEGVADEEKGQTFEYSGLGLPLISTKDIEYTLDLEEIEKLTDQEAKTAALAKWNKFFEEPQFMDIEAGGI